MRLLIDANLSPRVSAGLRSAGFDAIHVADVGLVTAADETILAYAAANTAPAYQGWPGPRARRGRTARSASRIAFSSAV